MVRLSLDAKPGRTLTSPCPDATIDESDVELGAETITAMGVTDSPLGSPVAVMDSTPFVVCTVRYLARSWFPTKLYEASPEPTCTPILKGVQFWIDVKASSVPSARARRGRDATARPEMRKRHEDCKPGVSGGGNPVYCVVYIV
jgi:hypothetical protein